jgi:hypothetical protein
MSISRTAQEIEDQYTEASLYEASGETAVFSETYESGVAAALAWVLGNTDSTPIEVSFDDFNS